MINPADSKAVASIQHRSSKCFSAAEEAHKDSPVEASQEEGATLNLHLKWDDNKINRIKSK
jgi:hypothetical protein